jgi:uncharacterized Fe-S cluster-containing radical SAM superfamily enzyme
VGQEVEIIIIPGLLEGEVLVVDTARRVVDFLVAAEDLAAAAHQVVGSIIKNKALT